MPHAFSRWCLATAVFLLAAAGAYAQQPRPAGPPRPAAPNVAASVNGEVIRLDQVDSVVKRLRTSAGPLTDAQARRLRTDVTNDLVDDLLIRQFLRKHGPKVEPAELDAHFRGLAVALQKQGKTVADFLRETGQSEAQARDTWATMIQFNKYVEQHTSPEELKKFYEGYKDFFDKVSVRVSHVVVRVTPDAPQGEWAAARQRLAAIRADILAGKIAFADAARKYSICPSAPAGGDLGFIARRDTIVDEAFARAAFALKPGEVSEPVDTEFGVHLILATERKAGTPSTFEKVAEQVHDCYADDLRQQLVARLRKQGDVQITVP